MYRRNPFPPSLVDPHETRDSLATSLGRRQLLLGGAALSSSTLLSSGLQARSKARWQPAVSYWSDRSQLPQGAETASSENAAFGENAAFSERVELTVVGLHETVGIDRPICSAGPKRISLDVMGGLTGTDPFHAWSWEQDCARSPSRELSLIAPLYDDFGLRLLITADGDTSELCLSPDRRTPSTRLRRGDYTIDWVDLSTEAPLLHKNARLHFRIN